VIRASIGRILRMSGRGERCEQIWSDFLDPGNRGLASDGSTPYRLQLAIIAAACRRSAMTQDGILFNDEELIKKDAEFVEKDVAFVEKDQYVDGEGSNTPPPSPAWH
jgi:hypothetical protein